jgi:hypothetical protein
MLANTRDVILRQRHHQDLGFFAMVELSQSAQEHQDEFHSAELLDQLWPRYPQ